MAKLDFNAGGAPKVIPDDMLDLGASLWRTRDGRELTWSQMSVSHLRNTAALIERNGVAAVSSELSAAWSLTAWFQGEHALDSVYSGIDQLEDQLETFRQTTKQLRKYADWRESVGWLYP